jgi:hypothetical protein
LNFTNTVAVRQVHIIIIAFVRTFLLYNASIFQTVGCGVSGRCHKLSIVDFLLVEGE